VLLSAWIGQLIGDRVVGADVSGFFGALAMTPIALAVARLPGAPPRSCRRSGCSCPGALGLIGVTEVIGDPATASIEDLVTSVGAIVSIALGILGGVSLYRGLAAARPRLGSGPQIPRWPIPPIALRRRRARPCSPR
jgi:hypothetical protein